MPKSLSNSKMGRLVARLFGKESLDVQDGKVLLSDEERSKVIENYGQAFLDKLMSTSFEEEGSASDLFNEAVKYQTEKNLEEINATVAQQAAQIKAKDATIAKLQKDITVLAAEPEPLPAAGYSGAAMGAQVFHVDLSARHNRLAAEALASDNPAAFMRLEEGGIDVQDLNNEFGTALQPRARVDILNKRIYRGFNDSQHMRRIQSDRDYKASVGTISEVVQQFTPKFTPKGAVKFTPTVIPYRRHKINVLISPAEIIKSWILSLYEQGKSMDQQPITKYIVEEHIVPKILDDITLSMIGKGRYKEVSWGAVKDNDEGSAASESMDGYETLLVDGKSDSKCKFNFYKKAVNPFELNGQELLDYFKDFATSISGYFAKKVRIHLSEQLLTHYLSADYAVNGKYTGTSVGKTIRFTKFELVPLESMYNSQIIFATPKENFIEMVDASRADRCIYDIQKQNYDVKIFGEFSLSVGFLIQEAVFAAVPEGYDPQATIASEDLDLDKPDSKWMNGGTGASSATRAGEVSEEEGA